MTNRPLFNNSGGEDQDQFLTILSREDAIARFDAALFPRAIASERRKISDALGCALAEDIVAPVDVPPFDRSNVDGFAVRAADIALATEAMPVAVMLNDEMIACGTAPGCPVLSGTATRSRPVAPCRAARTPSSWSSTPSRRRWRDRNPPLRVAGPIRILRRLGHRARRGAAASRHRDRIARDRHARGVRHRTGRRCAQAARRRDLHRR